MKGYTGRQLRANFSGREKNGGIAAAEDRIFNRAVRCLPKRLR
jgi:hypothetical protein